MKIQTDSSFYNTDDGNYQRSSALKTLEACSWSYFCSYVLKLPQETNEGALKGNVCHTFFESLINPRHKKVHKAIVSKGSVSGSKAAERLVYKLIKRFKLKENKDMFDFIDSMIMVGLTNDFYSKGGEIIGKEYRFKIKNENPKYAIYGTMDKIVIKGKNLIIEDYKSSKKKYEGEEVAANVQALMYSLAAKKLWPDLKPIVRFIFLQFPKNPFVEIKISDNVLRGFEEYLASIQNKVDNFTLADAKDNFAADKQAGTNTFTGKLVCGFASQKGQLKKDGTKMYYCPFKFPYDYYAATLDGKVVRTALTIQELNIQEGEGLKKQHYDGCPRWVQPISDFKSEKVVDVKPCAFDDF